MQKVTYTNSRGDSIVFSHRPPFILSEIEGLGDVDADIQSQESPYQDGSTHIDTTLVSRYINMEISIVGKNTDEYRRFLSKVMNPKLNGVLKYEDGSITREIMCINEHVPNYPTKGKAFQLAVVNLECPNPYWRSPNETTKPLVAYEGGFTLPFTLPFTLGRSGSKTVLYNDGDVPAPMRIEIHGPTTNPQIFNRTTGEHIRINRTVAEGEVMHINTESGRQRITVTDENGNETNAFGYLDSESSILSQFNLELGENEIEHVADAGNRHAEVIVRWDDLYVGV